MSGILIATRLGAFLADEIEAAAPDRAVATAREQWAAVIALAEEAREAARIDGPAVASAVEAEAARIRTFIARITKEPAHG